MTTILVTGDTGFVGQALVRELLSEDNRVIGVSRSTNVDETVSFSPRYRHIVSSTADLTAELVGEPVDVVVDLAWAGSMGSDRGDKHIQAQNVEAAVHTTDLAAELDAKLYVGVGTITELTALAPDAPEGPATVYGLAKHLAHQETKKHAVDHEIDHIWVRLGNTYSEHDTSGRFLNSTLGKLAKNEPVTLLTGNQPFDFIHLSDAVRAVHRVIVSGRANEIYYVGNGDVATIEDFVSVAINTLGSTSEVDSHHVEKIGLTPADLDNESLQAIGYTQTVSFIDGVQRWKHTNS